jgi:hypothetical protein
MIKWLLKKFLKNKLNDLLSKGKDSVKYDKILFYIEKFQYLIDYLKLVALNLADSELTDEEFDKLEKQGKNLIE